MNREDERHLATALRLAARGRFRVAPNPCVGAVLVRDGVVDFETAVGMGENALHGNARRLYGWKKE